MGILDPTMVSQLDPGHKTERNGNSTRVDNYNRERQPRLSGSTAAGIYVWTLVIINSSVCIFINEEAVKLSRISDQYKLKSNVELEAFDTCNLGNFNFIQYMAIDLIRNTTGEYLTELPKRERERHISIHNRSIKIGTTFDVINSLAFVPVGFDIDLESYNYVATVPFVLNSSFLSQRIPVTKFFGGLLSENQVSNIVTREKTEEREGIGSVTGEGPSTVAAEGVIIRTLLQDRRKRIGRTSSKHEGSELMSGRFRRTTITSPRTITHVGNYLSSELLQRPSMPSLLLPQGIYFYIPSNVQLLHSFADSIQRFKPKILNNEIIHVPLQGTQTFTQIVDHIRDSLVDDLPPMDQANVDSEVGVEWYDADDEAHADDKVEVRSKVNGQATASHRRTDIFVYAQPAAPEPPKDVLKQFFTKSLRIVFKHTGYSASESSSDDEVCDRTKRRKDREHYLHLLHVQRIYDSLQGHLDSDAYEDITRTEINDQVEQAIDTAKKYWEV